MSLIGCVGPFDENVEEFSTYKTRVELFFKANQIEDSLKSASFLSIVGRKIFTLVKNLLSPKDPATATYTERNAIQKFE